jgi:hypothetical protein
MWAAEIIRSKVASVKELSVFTILATRLNGFWIKSNSFATANLSMVGISHGKAGCGSDEKMAPGRDFT